ncbi:hypothetical protein D3C85_1760710 [compost metagenome]
MRPGHLQCTQPGQWHQEKTQVEGPDRATDTGQEEDTQGQRQQRQQRDQAQAKSQIEPAGQLRRDNGAQRQCGDRRL